RAGRRDPLLSPWVPGLAALARDTRHRRRAQRTVGRHLNSRCQTAQCCLFPRRVAASGFIRLFACTFASPSAGEPTRALAPAAVATAAIPSPRPRGGWSADRRTL